MIAGSAVGSSMCHVKLGSRSTTSGSTTISWCSQPSFRGKSNRVGPQRLLSRHRSNDTRRIQPRTQKSADRNIAHHLLLDRCAEPCPDLVRQIILCSFEAVLRRRER